MGKTYKDQNAENLAKLLKRINQGANPRIIRREANQIMATITPEDIAAAESSLVKTGYSAQLAEHLATAFMLMGSKEDKNQRYILRQSLKPNHVLRKVMAEHELLECFVADLVETNEKIQKMNSLKDSSAEFMKLSHIIEHLDAMEEHAEREEDLIFPYLKKYGWTSLTRTARSDHVYLKIAINDLIRLLGSYRTENLADFKIKLNSITKYVAETMKEHILQEENILFPIALELIKDPKVWGNLKELCDMIGYCGSHC